MTRSRQGKFCGGQPPLGLMRDPEDKGHLILDPETAPVIRKIYDMALDGWGCMRIAKQLMDDKIPITRVKSNTECDVNYAPTLMTLSPVRNGRSLRAAMRRL